MRTRGRWATTAAVLFLATSAAAAERPTPKAVARTDHAERALVALREIEKYTTKMYEDPRNEQLQVECLHRISEARDEFTSQCLLTGKRDALDCAALADHAEERGRARSRQ